MYFILLYQIFNEKNGCRDNVALQSLKISTSLRDICNYRYAYYTKHFRATRFQNNPITGVYLEQFHYSQSTHIFAG